MKKTLLTLMLIAATLGSTAQNRDLEISTTQDSAHNTTIHINGNNISPTSFIKRSIQLLHDLATYEDSAEYYADSLAQYIYQRLQSYAEEDSVTLKRLPDTVQSLFITIDDGSAEDKTDHLSQDLLVPPATPAHKKSPSVGCGFRFLWGFHNWGDNMLNGLGGMSGAYGLRTSFSSYQLELMANIRFSSHWKLGVGIGYESDVYKFRSPFVDLGTNADGSGYLYNSHDFYLTNTDALDYAPYPYYHEGSTRLVARYINIPVRLGYTFRSGDFFLALCVIPGFNYDGKHTGLKHKYKIENTKGTNVSHDIEAFISPFKCDLRLEVGKKDFGFFIQIPTMPVNTNMGDVKLYPFKIGFFI